YYIKEFEEETNLRAHLLVDASGSMAYKGAHPSKFEYAQYVAASLAYLMLHQRDAVGLVTHDTRIRQIIKPKASAKHLLHLLRTLEGTAPGGETSMAPLWHDLAGQIKRRGLIVILSDCFDQLPALMRALQHFRHERHEILLFHVLAPEEMEFPFKKWTQFRNLEVAGHRLLVDPQRLRKEYLRNFHDFCKQLRDQAGQMQIDYHLLRTDEPVDRALGAYLTRRQMRR
ncbi:MAG TPA: VWA domain-containing protein, partial [Gemmataceae bacterium]|nr:VWA domain-containing protein [Gemmataceae bacterium]